MICYDDLYYGNVLGGRLDGFCAIHLELGGGKKSHVETLLSTILSFPRTKIFKFSGDFKHSSEEDLFSLLSTLKENGYIIIGVLDGHEKREWMEQISLRVVEISEEPWLSFAASEIHFKPLKKEKLEPPSLTDLHAQALCYLDVHRDMTSTTIFDFIKRYPAWRIYSLPSKVYRMPLTLKEEE